MAENEKRQRDAVEEREKMLVRIEQNKRIEAEEQARAKAKGRQYGADIVGQINYNQRMKMADQVCGLIAKKLTELTCHTYCT